MIVLQKLYITRWQARWQRYAERKVRFGPGQEQVCGKAMHSHCNKEVTEERGTRSKVGTRI